MAEIKPYTKKEIINLYGVTYKTFSSWIKKFSEEIGEYKGRRSTINQVQTIFNKLGNP
jgi:transposase